MIGQSLPLRWGFWLRGTHRPGLARCAGCTLGY